MAAEFFGNVAAAIERPSPAEVPGAPVPAAAGEPAVTGVFTAPAKVRSQDDFLKGIAVGAGLVLLGVIAGSVFGRRR
jgi:hypothetical protein